jgi:hypothetical protein
MKRAAQILLISILSVGLMTAVAAASETMAQKQTAYEVSRLLWKEVERPGGEYLGRIADFVVDTNGRVEFAVLLEEFPETADNRLVALPYGALSLRPEGDHFVLSIGSEELASVPTFNEKDLSNPQFAEDIYRYFGQQPYWMEESDPAAMPASPFMDQVRNEKWLEQLPSGS